MDEAFERARSAYGTGAYDDATLEFLFPQLKDSEDERIKKIITDSVFYQYGAGVEYKDVLDYLDNLEKQKEQKPAEKQDYSGLNDLERAIHRGFLAAGVENVPVGIIKETAKDCLVQTGLIRWELPEDFEDAVFNVVNFMSPFSSEEELREISHHFAEQLLSLAKEEIQKSTWSDDDENMLNEILENYKLRIYLGKSEIEWIESLKHRIQLQPKQEWSDEDEKIRRNLMSLLANMRGDRITEETYQKYYPWLKSLRPSWKPSKEQMEALKRCVEYLEESDNEDTDILAGLYEQLKQL